MDILDIKEYKKSIEKLYDEKSSQPISNRQAQHAAALYELFFKKAKKQVNVFCLNACSSVFDEPSVQAEIKNALSRNILVKFLVQKPTLSCRWLDNVSNSNFELSFASSADAEREFNFCVVDGRAFRYEKSREDKRAFAKMNALDDAAKLNHYFNRMWSRKLDTNCSV